MVECSMEIRLVLVVVIWVSCCVDHCNLVFIAFVCCLVGHRVSTFIKLGGFPVFLLEINSVIHRIYPFQINYILDF